MMHTVIVRNRRVAVVSGGAVADNYGTDVVDLRLDSAFYGCEAVLILGCGDSAVRQIWTGEPLPVPGSLMVEGDIPVSVAGFRDGVRIVTAAGASIHVDRAGCYDGSDPAPDDPDMLQQLVQAAGDARSAAEAADKAAASATSAASAATEAAGKVDAAVDSATKATKAATDAATDATDAAKSANDAADTAERLAKDIPAYVTAAQQAATEAARAASDADGSATEAGKSASSAAGSAEQAAGSATTAQGSAEEASGSAQQAATSAGEAAGSATAASESAEAAQEHASDAAQSATEAESWADAAQVSAGNVLTGTASGAVAHADDAYAAKPREVRIEGRTVNNLWVNPSGTVSGVTVTSNGDGSMTMSGTASTSASVDTPPIYLLRPSTAYTIESSSTTSQGVVFAIYYFDADGGNAGYKDLISPSVKSTTFTTLADFSYAVFRVYVPGGTTASGTYRLMLNEGSTAQPWCPPGLNGVDALSVVCAGKNLLATSGKTATDVGITVSFDGGVMTASGTKTTTASGSYPAVSQPIASGGWLAMSANALPPDGCYIFASFWTSYNVNVGYELQIGYNGDNLASAVKVPDEARYVRVGFGCKPVFSGVVDFSCNLQLELDTVATDYEPPDVTEVTLPDTGPLMDGDALIIAQDGAVSVDRSDGTTDQLGTVQTPQLPAPTFNVYPTGGYVPGETSVGYERDVNIAYAELEAKISALTVAQATS